MIRRHEKGLAFIPLLVILSVGSLLIPAFLDRLDTRLISPPKALAEPIDYYSAESGTEHAVWRLVYEAGFPAFFDDDDDGDGIVGCEADNPDDCTTQYTVTVNGEEVPVTVTQVQVTPTPIPTPTPLPTPDPGPQDDRIEVGKTVNPISVPACETVTLTYTINVANVGTSVFFVEELNDLLPDNNFNYVIGSTQVLFPNDTLFIDPVIGSLYGRPLLTWDFGNPGLMLKNKSEKNEGKLKFQVTVNLQEGAYFNDAWTIARPQAVSQSNTYFNENNTLTTSGTERFDILAASGSTVIRASVNTSNCGADILSWIVE